MSDEPFLARWSRRKHEARDERPAALPEAEPPPPAPIAETESEPPPDLPPPDLPPPDLPPVESLGKESDYRPFLAPGVPEELRRAALRVLWRSDPLLANLDGLNDYDGDFTLKPDAVEVVKTIWKAGGQLNEALDKVVTDEPGAAATAAEADSSPAREDKT